MNEAPVKRGRGRPPKIKAQTEGVKAQTTVEPKKVRVSDYIEQARLEDESDMLYIPPEIIPEGMRYNWKTYSVLGQPQNRRFGRFQTTGWEPVPASRHPGLFTPVGYEGMIEYDGLVLMEKPEEMCKATEARELMKARDQVRHKEAQLRGGHLDGVGFDTKHPTALRANKVGKTYEKIDIPDK